MAAMRIGRVASVGLAPSEPPAARSRVGRESSKGRARVTPAERRKKLRRVSLVGWEDMGGGENWALLDETEFRAAILRKIVPKETPVQTGNWRSWSYVFAVTKLPMDITNKAKRPLSVPLPGGKKLFLAPGKSGQVSPKALKHPPLVKLLEAGDIETADGGGQRKGAGSSKISPSTGARTKATGAMRQSGDR